MELESIFSQSKTVQIAKDKSVSIKQIELGDIPKILSVLSKVMDALGGTNKKGNLDAIVLKVISEDYQSFLSLFEATTDLNMEEIKKLNAAATAKILAEVIKENVSFLQMHVVPIISEMKSSLGGTTKSKS